jgi:uncharacterized membrane protein
MTYTVLIIFGLITIGWGFVLYKMVKDIDERCATGLGFSLLTHITLIVLNIFYIITYFYVASLTNIKEFYFISLHVLLFCVISWFATKYLR